MNTVMSENSTETTALSLHRGSTPLRALLFLASGIALLLGAGFNAFFLVFFTFLGIGTEGTDQETFVGMYIVLGLSFGVSFAGVAGLRHFWRNRNTNVSVRWHHHLRNISAVTLLFNLSAILFLGGLLFLLLEAAMKAEANSMHLIVLGLTIPVGVGLEMLVRIGRVIVRTTTFSRIKRQAILAPVAIQIGLLLLITACIVFPPTVAAMPHSLAFARLPRWGLIISCAIMGAASIAVGVLLTRTDWQEHAREQALQVIEAARAIFLSVLIATLLLAPLFARWRGYSEPSDFYYFGLFLLLVSYAASEMAYDLLRSRGMRAVGVIMAVGVGVLFPFIALQMGLQLHITPWVTVPVGVLGIPCLYFGYLLHRTRSLRFGLEAPNDTIVEPEETSSEPGFYTTGGTLRQDAPSYITRRADDELLAALNAHEFCFILNARQMGKSSLMVRTASRLKAADAMVIVIDLTTVGQNLTVEQWYDGLLIQIGEQTGMEDELEDFFLENDQLGPMQRFFAALTQIVVPRYQSRSLVLFVDEVDVVRSLPFSTDEFFAGIRALYNGRTTDPSLSTLTFCLLGAAMPADLIRDVRITPFNIGHRIELTDFTPTEAAPLANGLHPNSQRGQELLRRILYWTGGHPYLTQRLCSELVRFPILQRRGETIDQLCYQLFLSPRAHEKDDNLLFVRERILRAPADPEGVAALLSLYEKVLIARLPLRRPVEDNEADPRIGQLRIAGIVRSHNGLLYVRNRIYATVFNREWVENNLPNDEMRRSRAAFQRGVFAAIGVVVPTAALALAGLIWWQAINLPADAITPNQPALPIQNAYDYFNLAGATLANGPDKVLRQKSETIKELLTTQLVPLTPEARRQIVAQNHSAIELVEQGVQYRHQIALPLSYKQRNDDEEYNTRILSLAKLLYLKASTESPEQAAQTVRPLYTLSVSVEQGNPTADTAPVSALARQAIQELRPVARLSSKESHQLIVDLLKTEDKRPTMLERLNEWEQRDLAILKDLFHQPHWRSLFQESYTQRSHTEEARGLARLFSLTISPRNTVSGYEQAMSQIQDQVSKGEPLSENAFATLSSAYLERFLPGKKVIDTWQETREANAGLIIRLALQQYQKEKGVYPKTLQDLTPQHLPHLPKSSKSLRYKRVGDSYTLDSIPAK